ncbi:MAG TPA: hypothetical protein VKV37_10520 [Ktedonobacteraceae bacterium]|nr:hypothetical protein [Ktedonobacteraceae bacterium]
MFNTASYRRGVIEGIIIYTIGRLCALITPSFFPGWTFVAAPLLFLALQYLIAPLWATRRIAAPKRERLSRRFWLLGPRLAAICLAIDGIVSLTCGLALSSFTEVQQGPVLLRLFASGHNALSLAGFGFYELKSAAALFAFFTLVVVCTKLAQGGFLRFTMPAGGNRVTL